MMPDTTKVGRFTYAMYIPCGFTPETPDPSASTALRKSSTVV
jgi:hypothetical protein